MAVVNKNKNSDFSIESMTKNEDGTYRIILLGTIDGESAQVIYHRCNFFPVSKSEIMTGYIDTELHFSLMVHHNGEMVTTIIPDKKKPTVKKTRKKKGES